MHCCAACSSPRLSASVSVNSRIEVSGVLNSCDTFDTKSLAPSRIAIVRTRFTPERRWSLEYPAGTVLYDTPNWIEAPRVSSDGTRVAFFEHPPVGGDNRGHVSVVTRSKEKSDVTGEYSALTGLAWHPNGEVWFGGADTGLLTQLLAVRPGAAVRRVAGLPVALKGPR